MADKNLIKLGFHKPNKEVLRRLILSIQGPEKVGKTHLALSAPKPLAYFNLDFRTEGVIERFADQDIQVIDIEYDLENEGEAEVYMEVLNKFHNAYSYATRHFKTVVEDTATEVWELMRLAHLGKRTQVMPHHYVQVNTAFRQHVREAEKAGINLVMIHKLKEEWVNNSNTGRLIRDGFKGMNYLAQTLVDCWKHLDPLVFGCTILECGQNPAVTGDTMEGDFYDYDALLEAVFG
jgi:hypothetical protein